LHNWQRKNLKLKDDNNNLVKQLLKMKETRAQLLNELLMGSIPSYKLEDHMKIKLSTEEDEINQVIKPEYLKNSAVDNITVSRTNFDLI